MNEAKVIPIDEKRREKWVRTLEAARECGGVAIFSAMQTEDATILPFVRKVES